MGFVIGSKIVLAYLNQSKVKAKELPSMYVEKIQNGGRNSQKALRVLFLLQWDRFLEGGGGLFHVVWRKDLEVHLERTQNYCVELLALYLRRMII